MMLSCVIFFACRLFPELKLDITVDFSNQSLFSMFGGLAMFLKKSMNKVLFELHVLFLVSSPKKKAKKSLIAKTCHYSVQKR